MGTTSDRPRRHLKQTWLRMLQAGAGTLVIASAVVSAAPAGAATPPAPSTIEQRVQQARAGLQARARSEAAPDRLAWWGNRIGIVRPVPVWPNWPNWNNWHNWANYGGPPASWGNY